jgi:hypothetical protein
MTTTPVTLDLEAASARYAPVIKRLARDKRIRVRSARKRFAEMLKFLDVCADSSVTVSPPPRVDDAWHTFILFTRDYADYCDRRFGRFIHHEPTEAKDPDAYRTAKEEVISRFGPVDRRIWPECAGGFWFGGGFCSDGGSCGGSCGGGCGGGG